MFSLYAWANVIVVILVQSKWKYYVSHKVELHYIDVNRTKIFISIVKAKRSS